MAELLELKWLKDLVSENKLTEDRQLNISANIAAFTKVSTF